MSVGVGIERKDRSWLIAGLPDDESEVVIFVNVLPGCKHIWGILLVILLGVCTAVSVQSLSGFVCIEILCYEKSHLRSIIEKRRYVLPLILAETVLFCTQKDVIQISVLLQILLDFSARLIIKKKRVHFQGVSRLLGERSLLQDKWTDESHCLILNSTIVFSITCMGRALFETYIRNSCFHCMQH